MTITLKQIILIPWYVISRTFFFLYLALGTAFGQIRIYGAKTPKLMRWPRGSKNQLRIDGFRIAITIHILAWRWNIYKDNSEGSFYLAWLCFTLDAEPNYEYEK